MNLGDQPAFPRTCYTDAINPLTSETYETTTDYPGMSTRTWLAGMAMQGRAVSEEGSFQSRAKWAVQMADALIAELEKEKP